MSHWIKSEPLSDGGIRIRFSVEVSPFWDWLREKHAQSFCETTRPDKALAPDEDTVVMLEEARLEAHRERAAFFSKLEAFPCGNRGAIELRLDEDSALLFLQCINDLRIQSWHLLGCPEEPPDVQLEDANLWSYPNDLKAVRLVHEICGHIVGWITGALLKD